MKQTKGFTLIELMIVVAIIAIISMIAVSAYYASVAKSQMTEAISIADGLKTAVSEYQRQTGSCPSAGVGGILSPASYAGRFVATATVSTAGGVCVITTKMRNTSVSRRIQGKTLSLTMAASGGNAGWTCTSTASKIYLPKTCQ